MIPRGHLDIGWSDFAFAFGYCLLPGNRDQAEGRVEALWSTSGDALACLSVRSGLDLLLTALDYPPGTEVLMSAVNIRDMVRVVREHDLVPVPVDVDMDSLTVKPAALKAAASPRARVLLVAHLFGDRMPLDDVAHFAREHGLLLVEDCAQSYTGNEYTGHPGSDVTMFSFGPIKTATALGGALLRVADGSLRARMKEIQAHYPLQRRRHFFKRALRFALVRLALYRLPFTLFCRACHLLGKNHDDVINLSIRGFHGPRLLDNLRKRPSYPLLALLRRRVSRFDTGAIARRTASARTLVGLAPGIRRPGARAAGHTYWTFPVFSEDPDDLLARLGRRGFDATRGAWSLAAVAAPLGREDLAPQEAEKVMAQVVYLPTYPAIKERELPRLARAALGEEAGDSPTVPAESGG